MTFSDRRNFLTSVAASAAGVALSACATAQASVAPRSSAGWDGSWLERLNGPRRAIFDSAAIDNGIGIAHAGYYLDAVKDAFGKDPEIVLVVRHLAAPMLFGNALWARYGIGASEKIAASRAGEPATTNIFAARFAALQTRGVVVIGCNVALTGFAARYANASGLQRDAVLAEIKADLLPGVILQPSGVYAAHLAQHAGCSYVRSS